MTRSVRAILAMGVVAVALALAALAAPEPAGAQPAVDEPPATTTAPPSAPSTIPATTVPAEGRARITQDTPDLGGVLTLWGLGIAGTIATLAWSWQRNRAADGGA